MQPVYYIGVMSGTSLDGVDLALVDFTEPRQPQLVASDFTPMPEDLRQQIALLLKGKTTLQQLGELDHRLGTLYAACINAFLAKQNLAPQAVTVKRCGTRRTAISLLRCKLVMPTLSLRAPKSPLLQTRPKDLAFDGQGASLVPAFHQAV